MNIYGIEVLVLICAFVACGNGNFLRLDKPLNGILLSTDPNKEWNTIEIENENSLKAINSKLDLDISSDLKLEDEETHDVDSFTNFHHKTRIHHFARHGLCKHEFGKTRLYKALKSKLCHTTVQFAAQLVDDLCKDKGVHLDMWVRELFDFDGDGHINHFEKFRYDF